MALIREPEAAPAHCAVATELEKPSALPVAGEKPRKLAVSIDFSLSFSGPDSIRLHTILFAFAGYNSVGLGSILRVAGENRFDSSLGLDSCSLLIIGSLSGLKWMRVLPRPPRWP